MIRRPGAAPEVVDGVEQHVGALHRVAAARVADDDGLARRARGRRSVDGADLHPVLVDLQPVRAPRRWRPAPRPPTATAPARGRPGRGARPAGRRGPRGGSRPASHAQAPARDHERAGPVVPVDEELAGAHPPEVVHRHDRRRPRRLGHLDQAGAEGLQRVEVDDVGRVLRAGAAANRSATAGVVVVERIGPAHPRRGHHPAHRQPDLVDLVPGLQRRPVGVEVARRTRGRRGPGPESPAASRCGCSVPPLTKFGG